MMSSGLLLFDQPLTLQDVEWKRKTLSGGLGARYLGALTEAGRAACRVLALVRWVRVAGPRRTDGLAGVATIRSMSFCRPRTVPVSWLTSDLNHRSSSLAGNAGFAAVWATGRPFAAPQRARLCPRAGDRLRVRLWSSNSPRCKD